MSEKLKQFNSNDFFVACGEIFYFSDVAEFLITCNICKNENFENFTKFSNHLIECFSKFHLKTNKILIKVSSKTENEVSSVGLDLPNKTTSIESNVYTFPNTEIVESISIINFPSKTINNSLQDHLLSTSVETISKLANQQIELQNHTTTATTTTTTDHCDRVPEELLEQVLSLEDETSQKSRITPSLSINLEANSNLIESLISSTNNNEVDLVKNDILKSLSIQNTFYTNEFTEPQTKMITTTTFIPNSDCKIDKNLNEKIVSSSEAKHDLIDENNNENKLCHEITINEISNSDTSLNSCGKALKTKENSPQEITENNINNNIILEIIKKKNGKKSTANCISSSPYNCDKCQSSFKNVHCWLKHLRTVHNNLKPYSCDKCPKSFPQISRLKVHQRIHTGERPYKCSYCNRSFNQISHKQRHERTHTGEKPYVCKICGKSFTHPESLKAHHVTHSSKPSKNKSAIQTKIDDATGRLMYKCSKCTETFFQLSCLQLHNHKVHLSSKYTCQECGKSFNYSSNLTVHRRLHAPDSGKHLKCSFCDRLFRQLGHLRRHEQTHTGIKPYKCHICEKSFVEMKDLRNHLQRHSDVRFECDLCPKFYKLEYDLRRHKNRLHMNFESLQVK